MHVFIQKQQYQVVITVTDYIDCTNVQPHEATQLTTTFAT